MNGAGGGTGAPDLEGLPLDEDDADPQMPSDCVEVTEEEAVRIYEKGLAANKSSHGVDGGARQRATPAPST